MSHPPSLVTPCHNFTLSVCRKAHTWDSDIQNDSNIIMGWGFWQRWTMTGWGFWRQMFSVKTPWFSIGGGGAPEVHIDWCIDGHHKYIIYYYWISKIIIVKVIIEIKWSFNLKYQSYIKLLIWVHKWVNSVLLIFQDPEFASSDWSFTPVTGVTFNA